MHFTSGPESLVWYGFLVFNQKPMLTDASSLANIAYLIGDTLRAEYDIDPTPIYEELGMDPDGPASAGDRISNKLLNQLWERAAEASGDPALGVKMGRRMQPSHFFVIGHAWLASSTLLEAMERMMRYEEILDSGITDIRLEKRDDVYVISETYPNPADYPGKLSVDMSITSLIILCEAAMHEPVLPTRLELLLPSDEPTDIYDGLINGPIITGCERNALHFSAEDLDKQLPGSIPDILEATSSIAERYIASQVEGKVAHQVRELLVQMLPSGSVDQEAVAARLHCSASTLQRQLSADETSYRDVLESTRRDLAEAYLKEEKHAHAQIAFLVGFSDQSNFARAFKRWTGMSPGQFQKAEQ
jgi:AraC-like DNA-binding protein